MAMVRERRPVAAAAKKSWEQDERYDGLDLPDEDFDYDEFVSQEFSKAPHRKIGIKLYYWITGLVLLVLREPSGPLVLLTIGTGVSLAAGLAGAIVASRRRLTQRPPSGSTS